MSINDGKQEQPKTFSFCGHELKIGKIPAGCAIPFTIEIDKVRKTSLKAAEKIAMSADTEDDIERLTMQYYSDVEHLGEAHEILLQTIKAISVFTEYVTNGELTEDYILHNADPEEVNDLMIELQEAVNAPLKKHLAKLTKEEVVQ